ncbi:DUF3331 domain-containing protein [Paraburkholderia phytofirmans]|uniref:DUF3331 domain-containing protein n=1 Tax=Paraburkholderia phytofirmans TaxID=261302 RepID=UPI0038B8F5A8
MRGEFVFTIMLVMRCSRRILLDRVNATKPAVACVATRASECGPLADFIECLGCYKPTFGDLRRAIQIRTVGHDSLLASRFAYSGLKNMPSSSAFATASTSAAARNTRSEYAFVNAPRGPSATQATSINVVARLTEHTVSTACSDPTPGSYGDQLWRGLRARGSGVCAISGRAIARGGSVYSPRCSSPPLANAGAMILFSVIDTMPPQADQWPRTLHAAKLTYARVKDATPLARSANGVCKGLS